MFLFLALVINDNYECFIQGIEFPSFDALALVTSYGW